MKQITLQQLQSLIAYLKGRPWEEAQNIINMLTSLPTIESKKDTPVTPKK